MKSVVAGYLAAFCLVFSLIWPGACKPGGGTGHPGGPAAGGRNKIKVVTTLFPLYDMAKHIGGERAEVSLLLPPGVEAETTVYVVRRWWEENARPSSDGYYADAPS